MLVSSILIEGHSLLVQKCLCSPLTAFLLCNFIMDDVIFKVFFFSPVAWFDRINKICYIDVCPNVLKSNFCWSL